LVQPITLLALEQYIIAQKRRVQKKHCDVRAFGFIDEEKRIKKGTREWEKKASTTTTTITTKKTKKENNNL